MTEQQAALKFNLLKHSLNPAAGDVKHDVRYIDSQLRNNQITAVKALNLAKKIIKEY